MTRALSITPWGFAPKPVQSKSSQSKSDSEKKVVLMVLAEDESRSVQSYRADIKQCVQDIIRSCSVKNSHCLMHLSFGDNIQLHHDFKPINRCYPDDYIGQDRVSRSTALSDAVIYSVNALVLKAECMRDNDVSGVVLVLSDGRPNKSSYDIAHLRQVIENSALNPSLGSLEVVLIGVGDEDPYAREEIVSFCRDAGISQYVQLRDINIDKITTLTSFVCRNTSAQRSENKPARS